MKSEIKIKNPCHENWETDQPNKHGRFCLTCQRNGD